jgi:transposase
VAEDTASALFGVEGLRVFDAEREADGSVAVWVTTDHPDAAVCPGCGSCSARVHEYVLTRPRDLRRGLDEVSVAWCKRRWKCGAPGCGRVTFTENPIACSLEVLLQELLPGRFPVRDGRTSGVAAHK